MFISVHVRIRILLFLSFIVVFVFSGASWREWSRVSLVGGVGNRATFYWLTALRGGVAISAKTDK